MKRYESRPGGRRRLFLGGSRRPTESPPGLPRRNGDSQRRRPLHPFASKRPRSGLRHDDLLRQPRLLPQRRAGASSWPRRSCRGFAAGCRRPAFKSPGPEPAASLKRAIRRPPMPSWSNSPPDLDRGAPAGCGTPCCRCSPASGSRQGARGVQPSGCRWSPDSIGVSTESSSALPGEHYLLGEDADGLGRGCGAIARAADHQGRRRDRGSMAWFEERYTWDRQAEAMLTPPTGPDLPGSSYNSACPDFESEIAISHLSRRP